MKGTRSFGLLGCIAVGAAFAPRDRAPASPAATARQERFADRLKPMPLGVRVTVTTSESAVAGSTPAEVQSAMRTVLDKAPDPEARIRRSPLQARWSVALRPAYEASLGMCHVKELTITVSGHIDFPRLAAPVDSATQAWFADHRSRLDATYLAAFLMLRDGAKAIHERVQRMSGGTCGALSTQVNDLTQVWIRELNERAREAVARPTGP